MKLYTLTRFKLVFYIIAILLFMLQFKSAFEKLLNPPTLYSTELLHYDQLKLPIITICPPELFNQTKADDYGYVKEYDLPLAKYADGKISWGQELNMTYSELLTLFLKDGFKHDNFTLTVGMESLPLVRKYYTKYGFCWELANYDPSIEVLIGSDISADVYITDGQHTMTTSLYTDSHKGPVMKIEKESFLSYSIQVTQQSHREPQDEDRCHNYGPGEFASCVEEDFQNVLVPLIGCNPPWFSEQAQCKELDMNASEFAQNVFSAKVNPYTIYVLWMDLMPSQLTCKVPCTVTTSTVNLKGENKIGSFGWIRLSFDKSARVSRKIVTFGVPEFLVEIGK